MCTSHVLNTKNYDLDYSLCDIDQIIPTWEKCNKNYQEKGYPYELKGNCGKIGAILASFVFINLIIRFFTQSHRKCQIKTLLNVKI